MSIAILVVIIAILLVLLMIALAELCNRKKPPIVTPYTVKRGMFNLGNPGMTEDVYMITRMTRRGEEILAVFPIENNQVDMDLLIELKYLQMEGKTLTFK